MKRSSEKSEAPFFQPPDETVGSSKDALLKFEKECDNSTVRFLVEEAFESGRSHTIVIIPDSESGS
jgi:hypothetical protein